MNPAALAGLALSSVVGSLGGGGMASVWIEWERLTHGQRAGRLAAAATLVTLASVLGAYSSTELRRR